MSRPIEQLSVSAARQGSEVRSRNSKVAQHPAPVTPDPNTLVTLGRRSGGSGERLGHTHAVRGDDDKNPKHHDQ